MRLHRLVVVGVLGGVGVVIVACGLEQGGLLVESDGGLDSSFFDSGKPDIDVPIDVVVPDVSPPACATLDASACLPPYPADAGWKPIAIPTSIKNCPDPDAGWQATTFYFDASLAPGSCSCRCATKSPDCAPDGSVVYGNVATCSGSGSTLNLPNGVCVDNVTPLAFLQASYGPTTLATTCEAGAPGDAQALSTTVDICSTPACDIDFCGLKTAGYQRCIMFDQGNVNCPAGYQKRVVGKTTGAACGACGCNVTTPATCNATLTSWVAAGCNGNPLETYPLDAACTANLLSNSMQLNVVKSDAAACTATAPGSANIAGPVTLCCIP